MKGQTRRLKVSKNYKVFVSRVVKDGRVQKAFAAQIGKPVGGCVAAGVSEGMSGAAIHKIAADCAKRAKGTKLHLAGI
jgi:hypothetical protein